MDGRADISAHACADKGLCMQHTIADHPRVYGRQKVDVVHWTTRRYHVEAYAAFSDSVVCMSITPQDIGGHTFVSGTTETSRIVNFKGHTPE